jgi:hypothetical protein
MIDVTHYPLLVFVLSFIVLWLSARFGASFLRRQHPLDEDMRKDFEIILAATLTLLGLVIGFSFSMAINRYDQRKTYEEAEANAIGTEYVRANLLPSGEAAKLRALLKTYLDQRVLFFRVNKEEELRQISARTTRLQTELWSAVQAQAAAQPTPIVALVVAGMNDVLNAQGYTQAAWWNRIPRAAWALIAAIAIGGNVLVGYGSRSPSAGSHLLLVVPLLVSIAFMLIADIDTPRHGLIEVRPQNLISLVESLRAH